MWNVDHVVTLFNGVHIVSSPGRTWCKEALNVYFSLAGDSERTTMTFALLSATKPGRVCEDKWYANHRTAVDY